MSIYADDRGLTFEFSDIINHFHEQDFLVPELQTFIPPSSNANATTDDSTFMDTTVPSPSAIYGQLNFFF